MAMPLMLILQIVPVKLMGAGKTMLPQSHVSAQGAGAGQPGTSVSSVLIALLLTTPSYHHTIK